jgi:hypothetical protein
MGNPLSERPSFADAALRGILPRPAPLTRSSLPLPLNLPILQSSISAHCLRGEAEGPEEGTTHAFAIRETRFLCHDVNRGPALLNHEPGSFQPELFDGFCR